ncbi:FAR-17a/AIG1-like protein [Lineolata rhizophorae]|uniref:FAR-17a/AIG1-like protein n=1 Tax=Lineolata rhizophorae TaxID=578093 RepID=A0A6A6NYS3_9PEZI|nr:FAR-17a/AIG1-like protein [Lineolata rhizophorae]
MSSERHPLQRLPSPGPGLSAALHVVGLISFSSSFKYLVDHPNQINDSYGWHMQYLTILGLAAATLAFALGLAADLTGSAAPFAAKNAIAIGAAPLELVVSVLYWGLRLVDERLVLPDWAPRLPLAVDLGFHAAPALVLALDLVLFSPPPARPPARTFALSAALALAYWFWIELCFARNGFYPYPIFALLTPPWRVALFSAAAAIMTLSTFFLDWLYAALNGREPVTAPAPMAAKKAL